MNHTVFEDVKTNVKYTKHYPCIGSHTIWYTIKKHVQQR